MCILFAIARLMKIVHIVHDMLLIGTHPLTHILSPFLSLSLPSFLFVFFFLSLSFSRYLSFSHLFSFFSPLSLSFPFSPSPPPRDPLSLACAHGRVRSCFLALPFSLVLPHLRSLSLSFSFSPSFFLCFSRSLLPPFNTHAPTQMGRSKCNTYRQAGFFFLPGGEAHKSRGVRN